MLLLAVYWPASPTPGDSGRTYEPLHILLTPARSSPIASQRSSICARDHVRRVFAPVLVAQTLALGVRWRRNGSSRAVLHARTSSDCRTGGFGRHDSCRAPDATATFPANGDTPRQPANMDKAAASEPVSNGRTSGTPAVGDAAGTASAGRHEPRWHRPRNGIRSPMEHGSRSNSDGRPPRYRTGPPGSRDRLQQAITNTFRAEQSETRAQPSARNGSASTPDARGQLTTLPTVAATPTRVDPHLNMLAVRATARTARRHRPPRLPANAQGVRMRDNTLKETPRAPGRGRVHTD